MKTWKSIKKIPSKEIIQKEFILCENDTINKFKNYGIDIYFDSKYNEYSVSFFNTPVKQTFKRLHSCYRFIYRLAVEYMQYNKSYIEYFLKGKDLL